jgi:DMSO/TMAO reductase YedYZ heme-binding membrane subunit
MTGGRSHRRQGVRSGAAGPVGEHVPKLMVGLVAALIVVVTPLVMTKAGREIDAATQRFMLYYAGVFALVLLTASVAAGLMATDRIFMTPGHRVMAQAVHRAISFAALAFLVIHIVTEILAQRVHVIDSAIPFLSPYRTVYIGLGTIASDLVLLVVVTSIVRKRFTAHGKVWRWRAIHYASYAAFALGVLHGLLSGREAKPYVDWSYGFAIAVTVLALVVRFLAISLRSKRNLSAPPGIDQASGGPGSSPLRAAALSVTQAQLAGTTRVLPPAQSWALPPAARDGFAISGPFPAALGPPAAGYAAEASYGAYPDPAFAPLSAPAYAPGPGVYPYAAGDPPPSALTGAGGPAGPTRQPRYEPGYDGPLRFEGAPRRHFPRDDLSSYPYGPHSRPAERDTGPIPRTATGPIPQADTGPMRRLGTGPLPRADTGPMPRADTGPMPRAGTGPLPRAAAGPGIHPGTGPMPRTGTGPLPRRDSEPRLRPGAEPRQDLPPGPPVGPPPRAARRPRRAAPHDQTDRDVPGPAGGEEWR